jgi:uncharacterized membrane protein
VPQLQQVLAKSWTHQHLHIYFHAVVAAVCSNVVVWNWGLLAVLGTYKCWLHVAMAEVHCTDQTLCMVAQQLSRYLVFAVVVIWHLLL